MQVSAVRIIVPSVLRFGAPLSKYMYVRRAAQQYGNTPTTATTCPQPLSSCSLSKFERTKILVRRSGTTSYSSTRLTAFSLPNSKKAEAEDQGQAAGRDREAKKRREENWFGSTARLPRVVQAHIHPSNKYSYGASSLLNPEVRSVQPRLYDSFSFSARTILSQCMTRARPQRLDSTEKKQSSQCRSPR